MEPVAGLAWLASIVTDTIIIHDHRTQHVHSTMTTRLSGEDLRVGLRLLAALPRFLRSPFSLAEAREEVKQRFAQRADRFVDRVTEACRVPGSPYATLLQHVGCTLADLRDSVAREGVEGALHGLLKAGVYLTGEEFKSRRPVVRGSLEFTVNPAGLLNPRSVVHGLAESSGSRGARTPVPSTSRSSTTMRSIPISR